MITRATPDDIPAIVGMAARHHAASGAPGEYDAEAMAEYMETVFRMGAAFLSERGMIFGFLSPLYYDPAYLLALEIDWWSEDGRGLDLLAAFERWARKSQAREVRMSSMCTHRGEAVNRLLRRRGYVPSETSLRKVL